MDINTLLKKRVPPPAPKPPKRPPPAPSRDISSVREAPISSVAPSPPPVQALIDVKDLMLGDELGEGEFGSVLKGTWKSHDGKVLDVSSSPAESNKKLVYSEDLFLLYVVDS